MTDHDPVALAETEEPTADRLARIEAALSLIAARQAVGPAPEGYAPPTAPLPTTLSLAVQAAQDAGIFPGGEKPKRRRWTEWPVIREVRLVARMYIDPRYSPTRAAQLVVPFLLGSLVLNSLFWQWLFAVPILSPVAERAVVMVIGVVLYRILAAEIERYAAVLDYLERTGR